jgi:NTP pyrophosphatase (non-canonical NTP hydrolase)
MMKIKKMQKQVVRWICDHIPDERRDPVNTAIKLSEEVAELLHALYTDGDNVGEEVADCIILLLDIAHLEGVNMDTQFKLKMAINANRQWKLDKGCLSHANDD